jgi:DNA-binding transcriptional MerR regulator
VKKLFYRIGEACKQLDIQPYVLRYWETEFPVLSPKKSKAGQRVYSEEELRLIQRIKQLLYEEGSTIAGAKKKLEAELAADTLPELAHAAAAPAAAPERERRGVAKAPAGESPVVVSSAAPGAHRAVAVASAEDGGEAEEDDAADAAQLAIPGTEPPRAAAGAESGEAVGGKPSVNLDTTSTQQVETLRSGLRQALAQAREILALLGD